MGCCGQLQRERCDNYSAIILFQDMVRSGEERIYAKQKAPRNVSGGLSVIDNQNGYLVA